MNSLLTFVVGMIIAIPTAVSVWLVSYFAFDQTLMLPVALSFGGGILSYGLTSVLLKYNFLKKHRLTRSEYRYIKKNLDEAKPKIDRLNKALFSIWNISSLKQRVDLIRITRKIYSLTKKEPRRFFQAERFYFSHLDSAVELTEKFAFLSSQPKKSRELDQSLHETNQTLKELQHTIEQDLYQVIEDDINHLNFEIDVAKHTIKSLKESQYPKKAGDLNERK
ncbi:5-bromo-4-chloroindolyl phosphate hydrolysis family protein [Metabacillus arenae]|uniref:5-bromo-4-chloroindolyl phosphate hydrolysis family protein n=1 Tax=Metabacillus arenae TaxID=2771434 RepID=A0A926NFG4_9BACI|nr:5-bromo-4-chloroindolyl phosphate hydrolysis family protein [Metabacillus arenae]MBD1382499.1 5-bromo-4-chloroindolyl phosphate hydrolysis family protein [Metabacillus arenae]